MALTSAQLQALAPFGVNQDNVTEAVQTARDFLAFSETPQFIERREGKPLRQYEQERVRRSDRKRKFSRLQATPISAERPPRPWRTSTPVWPFSGCSPMAKS